MNMTRETVILHMRRKNMKKFLSALLCVLMVCPLLAACSGEPAGTPDDSTGQDTAQVSADTTEAVTEPPVTERKDAKDNIPADINLGG